MHNQIAESLRLRLDQRSNIAAADEGHARARLRKVHNGQSDEQRNRRDDLKVEQRLGAHAPDLLQIATARNADDERREN